MTALRQAANVQHLALAPTQHVWISANAGTGKTEVLVRRLIRLLIQDPTLLPSDVLALTFTRAAAAEMQLRLAQVAAAYAAEPNDQTLSTTLQKDLALTPTPQQLSRTRSLPALLVQAPPLMSTIHAFGQRLVSRFGAQAGFAPGARLMAESDPLQPQLLQEAQATALLTATGPTRDALDTLLNTLGEHTWKSLTQSIGQAWPALMAAQQNAGGWQAYLNTLRHRLGLPENGDDLPPLTPTPEEENALRILADAGSLNAVEVLKNPETYQSFLLTEKNTPKVRPKPIEANVAKKNPQANQVILDAQVRIVDVLNLHAGARTHALTQSLVLWAAQVQTHYTQLKAQHAVLDFADVLNGLETLLTPPEEQGETLLPLSAVWEGLDRNLRHLLVDEAQDNSPQQARIVQKLVREILSGEGSHATPRTVLAVGDMKQSIYRFQGAQPQYFLQLAETLEAFTTAPQRHLLTLSHSFRSSQVILNVVDATLTPYKQDVMGQADEPWPTHTSVHPERAGEVRLFPLAKDEPAPERQPWQLPHTVTHGCEGEVLMARQLAHALTQLHASGTVMPSTGQALRWSDVMILTKRNAIAAVVAGILQAHGIPVAGAKNVPNTTQADLTALIRLMLNVQDAHALAHVLKSPLVPLEDAARDTLLVTLHTQTAGKPEAWFEALKDAAPQAHALLTGWQILSTQLPPAAWVQAVAAQAQLPAAHTQPVEKMALEVPSLAHLLHRLQLLKDADKTPDPLPTEANAVRVLTVHGAKGLGAPLVVLADTTTALEGDTTKAPIRIEEDENGLPTGFMVRQTKENAPQLQKDWDTAEKTRARADSLRQLYVALTRPKDMLWVTGWQGKNALPKECWYALIQNGLTACAATPFGPDTEDENQKGLLLTQGAFTPAPISTPPLSPNPSVPLPYAPAHPSHPSGSTIAPPRTASATLSQQICENSPYLSKGQNQASTPAQQHGQALHALLQYLPTLPKNEWQNKGLQAARRILHGLSSLQDPALLLAQAIQIFEGFPWLASPAALREAELTLPGGTLGRADLLVFHEEKWWVIDYKTTPTPNIETFKPQLSAYVAAVRQFLGSTIPVKGAIFLTASQKLIPLDEC